MDIHTHKNQQHDSTSLLCNCLPAARAGCRKDNVRLDVQNIHFLSRQHLYCAACNALYYMWFMVYCIMPIKKNGCTFNVNYRSLLNPFLLWTIFTIKTTIRRRETLKYTFLSHIWWFARINLFLNGDNRSFRNIYLTIHVLTFTSRWRHTYMTLWPRTKPWHIVVMFKMSWGHLGREKIWNGWK